MKEERLIEKLNIKEYLYSTTDIIKNSLDTNDYKYVVLKNNLKLLLISDKNTDKSGCSLCVNVGSYNEPSSVNGLAHFLEHLLFMGTEKYPDENDYMAYLNMHNGSSNAYTCNDSTVYYFDVSNKHFKGALDRFAQFFISPLFNADSVDREISAVNSEFLGNVSNSSGRRYRLLELCYKEHLEESRFTIGNTNTLKIDNIRENVIDFYNKTYHADKMVAVVYSNKKMSEIEKMIEVFSEVAYKDEEAPAVFNYPCPYYNEYVMNIMKTNRYKTYSIYKNDLNVFKDDCTNKVIKLKSLEDTKRLDIFIKTIHPSISKNLYDVITENILKEDKGCIKILKDLNLSYEMGVYISDIKYYGLLTISVFLTDEGFATPEVVLDELEKYFAGYKITDEDLEVLISQNEINFEYLEKDEVIDTIEEMSYNLMRVPVKNILDYEYTKNLPSEDLKEEVMKFIRNRNEWVSILSSSEFDLPMKDPIFGIEYEIPN